MLLRILAATLAVALCCVAFGRTQECVNGVCAAGTQPISAPAPLPAGPHAPANVAAPVAVVTMHPMIHAGFGVLHRIRCRLHNGAVRADQIVHRAANVIAHPVMTARRHPVRNVVRGRRCR